MNEQSQAHTARMKSNRPFKLLLAVSIAAIFALFQLGAHYFFQEGEPESSHFIRESQIQKLRNPDASLNVPFLDKISKYWYVGGETEIRNVGTIRLTKGGGTNQHGLVLSNGMGDSTIDNFETIVTLKISPKEDSGRHALMGDGVAIVVTAEKDFLRQDLTSSYARRQYEINSGGVRAEDISMMGMPANLPGLALIVDTFRNEPKTRLAPPFLDIVLNTSPRTQAYDLESDGLKTTALNLNAGKTKLKKSVMQGNIFKIRLIYLESENFLKIDIQYGNEEYWIELFRTHLSAPLPRNEETNQRYIGISALTGELSQTVDLLSVETNEFHLRDKEDTSQDFFKEIELYFLQEYNEKIALEKDDFQRWKMAKSQPKYEASEITPEKTTKNRQYKKRHFFKNFIAFFIIITTVYLASVYIRVSMKHVISTKRHRSKSVGLLPH